MRRCGDTEHDITVSLSSSSHWLHHSTWIGGTNALTVFAVANTAAAVGVDTVVVALQLPEFHLQPCHA